MGHHEVVNDIFADTPISITYSPLTGSAVSFRNMKMSVSGYLYMNNHVLLNKENKDKQKFGPFTSSNRCYLIR